MDSQTFMLCSAIRHVSDTVETFNSMRKKHLEYIFRVFWKRIGITVIVHQLLSLSRELVLIPLTVAV